MNGHARAALDTIIEPPDSPMNSAGFYAFKPYNYGLEERLMSKKPTHHVFPTIFFGESFFLIPGGPEPQKFFFIIFINVYKY